MRLSSSSFCAKFLSSYQRASHGRVTATLKPTGLVFCPKGVRVTVCYLPKLVWSKVLQSEQLLSSYHRASALQRCEVLANHRRRSSGGSNVCGCDTRDPSEPARYA